MNKTTSIKISEKHKIQLFSNMSTMLAAGIPILETVVSLLEESKNDTKKILTALKSDLEAGKNIHESFSHHPRSFDKVTVNLIKAAEEAGNLEVALNDIKDGIQKEMEFSDKIKSAMMYPVFVLLVFIGVMLAMLIVVIPRIATVFTRLNAELPLPTRGMIFASDILIHQWQWVILTLFIFTTLIAILMRFQKPLVMNILFSLPFISDLVKQVDVTRFTRSMHLLLNSGLPIVASLELAQDVMRKKEMQKLVENARLMVMDGKRLSDGLRTDKKLMGGMTIKLIEVGEKSGSLNESMKNISETLDYEVTRNLQTATSLLEPIMLVFVGLVVGGMMMSIIGPIYGLISDVQLR